MTPEAIGAVAQAQASGAASAAAAPRAGAAGTQGVAESDFARMVGRALGEVNEQLLVSQADVQRLATGDVQNLHQIMIRLEESRLSFQLFLQVRNRLLEAYQDVMKMQV